MSKHHRHGNNNPNNQRPPVDQQAPEATAPATPGVLPELPEAPLSAPAPEKPAQPVSVIVPTAEPKAEEVSDVQKVLAATAGAKPVVMKEPQPAAKPVAPVAPAPKAPVEVKAKPIKKEERVMAEQIYPSQSIQQRRAGIRPSKTPMGQRLAKLYEEYKALMSQRVNPNDQMAHRMRAKKLFELFSVACPATKLDSMVAADLVRVSYDSIMDGWGSAYNDGTVFRMDYTLPSPRDIDRVDMFFTAVIQLVEGTVNHRRVMFDRTRLGQVLGNEAIVAALVKMRDGVNNYNTQRGYFNVEIKR